MVDLQDFVKGECMTMCPEEEIILREKENLVHILETNPATEKQKNKKVKLKGDKEKMVKCFSRSAAGKNLQDPKCLRPPLVLLKTTEYLLDDVVSNTRVPWTSTYDFIMDRLRSVRQDMVIQSIPIAHSICILQPIVRFYAYAQYRLCSEPLKNFDPHINQTHLQECLKKLLYLYDECDIKVNNDVLLKHLENIRPEFEALYVLINLGDPEALLRSLNLPKTWRNHVVKLAIKISLNYLRNNFVRVCRLITHLPPLLLVVTTLQLSKLRRKSLKIMSVAYNSKNLTFPLNKLQELLLYNNDRNAIEDCKYYNIKCDEKNKTVQFVKADFDENKPPVLPTHLDFVDKELKAIKLSELILAV